MSSAMLEQPHQQLDRNAASTFSVVALIGWIWGRRISQRVVSRTAHRLSRCALVVVLWVAGAAGGCLQPDSDVFILKGPLEGQVVISGGVRGARIWVDQLDGYGEVHRHVGEVVTDEAGRFAIETESGRGIFRISARGGAYRDLATGATVQLDESDEIVSLTGYEVLALRGPFLVSPISHMIAARTMERLRAGGEIWAAFVENRASFHKHFGDVDWGQVIPWPLDQHAPSPTEPVRAAFVLAALSVLASNIAADAQAGPQDVNVYRLMEKLTEDIRADTFEGNDGDSRAPGSGLQLGLCPPVDPGCVPGDGCSTSQCRAGCDIYSGTVRSMLAGAMVKVIQDTSINRTGLDLANTISIVHGVSDNADPALFAASCVETPALSFQLSSVRDEDTETVTFAADHSPQHAHTGMPIDLATPTGCPALTKFSHLLGSTQPEYVVEDPGRNPIQYQLVIDDAGVGIAPGSTQYRVGRRRPGLPTIWGPDWTSAGIGDPVGTGVTRFPVGIYSDVVSGLATVEATYDVEFRTTDRLGHTATAARCFVLRLRAPPADFEVMGSQPTKVHAYALDSLSLAQGAPLDQVAARLLNNDATGASLLDQDIFNGTTSTIYLTVTVTPPSSVVAAQSFVVANAPTEVSPPCMGNCPPALATKVSEDSGSGSAPMTTLHFPVRTFELVGGVPTTEIPCLAPCRSSDTEFRFAIPPRPSSGRPARAFRVMTMIGQVSGLWPRKPGQEAAPPFEDTAITWQVGSTPTTTRLTGIVDHSFDPSRTGCVDFDYVLMQCRRTGTLVPYRALASASLTFTGNTYTRYATAAAASIDPDFLTQRFRASTQGWATSEGTLPEDLLQP
jgi:hypothetical protein